MEKPPANERSLTSDERKLIVEGSLKRLQVLHNVVDQEPSVCLYMAIEMWNVFNNSWIQPQLKTRKFPTPAMYKNGRKMELLFPLVGFQIQKNPLGVAFSPVLSESGQGMKYDYIPFKDWWRKEIAHQPMRSPEDQEKVDVSRLTRFGLIRDIRNKLAAHQDHIRPRLLDEIEQSLLIKDWGFEMEGISYKIGDGKLTVTYPYLYALLRQMNYETLRAFEMVETK
ncbi:MAG: hypothetical protein IBJ12_02365 [Sphingomonadaceae bacterium]|nr:hypothetical protein [Sphingomonadaceae bacterium]